MKIDDKITAVPQWDKTAKEVWDERFAALTDDEEDEEQTPSAPAPTLRIAVWGKRLFSVAAALLLLFSATAYFYAKNLKAATGQTLAVVLPDGSQAQLSSASELSYRPLLWMLSHKVTLQGEAYFSGHHAKNFTVETANGDINVLGTSFNARSFDDQLEVACIDGRVKVSTRQASVVLTAGMETATRAGQEQLTTRHFTDAESITGWTHGVFFFYNRPLTDVLKEVERHYGVKIETADNIDTLRYTGRFTRDKSAADVLTIIGQPYGITFKITK